MKKYKAMVLSCIDPRFQPKVFNYLKKKNLTGKYSSFTIAGGSIGVTAKKFKKWHLTFWENLSSSSDLKLSDLNYGVLALGDSSHYDFCNAGKIIDDKLKELGANRILDRQECDFDTEGSMEWSEKFLSLI